MLGLATGSSPIGTYEELVKKYEAGELDFTYYSAKATVLNALKKVKNEKNMKRVSKFLKEETCPTCHGSRIDTRANSTLLGGKTLTEVCAMSLKNLAAWLPQVSIPLMMM